MSLPPKIKIGLVSLGCAKNLVDSEVMLGSLVREGMEIAADARDADVLIVNTCGFVDAAKKESLDAVMKAGALREKGNCKALIVAGCLTQRYPKELREQLPRDCGVDAIIGLNEVPRIGEIVREVLSACGSDLKSRENGNDDRVAIENRSHAPRLFWSGPAKYTPDFVAPRFRLTPRHLAYVKISEGCDHPCTFCSIPRIRGKYRSRSVEDVLAEVRGLVRDGVREINLISQDTTVYGRDLLNKNGSGSGTTPTTNEKEILRSAQNDKGREHGTSQAGMPTLPNLLREIQKIDGEFWVRVLYTHPAHWSDELIETIASCDKVCRYADMPLQHISDEVLMAMRRETDGTFIRNLVRKIRAGIPGVALRTAFIVGFPGETEKHFEELLGFMEETRFERLGIFQYSREDHTPAGEMEKQVPNKIKKERYHRAMTLQQKISRRVLSGLVGSTMRVLVEEPAGELPSEIAAIVGGMRAPRKKQERADRRSKAASAGKWWVGRTHADTPEVDGAIYVRGSAGRGEFVKAQICASGAYDVIGEMVSA